MNKYIEITRTVKYRIEIIDRAVFENALNTYWKERNVFNKTQSAFLQHLALLAENGFIENEVQRFGVCVRVENQKCKIK